MQKFNILQYCLTRNSLKYRMISEMINNFTLQSRTETHNTIKLLVCRITLKLMRREPHRVIFASAIKQLQVIIFPIQHIISKKKSTIKWSSLQHTLGSFEKALDLHSTKKWGKWGLKIENNKTEPEDAERQHLAITP